MIKTALTVNISHVDLQHHSYLVNSTHLGLLSAAAQNIHIQTSHRQIQHIIGIRADEQDIADGLSGQRALLNRWLAFLPVLAQRGCPELNATLVQYQLQPDLMICYDQNRLLAWIPEMFGFYLLRDGELRKLRPVSQQEVIFDPAYHEKHLYYTLQIHHDDFYLLLPPDLPNIFAAGEIAGKLLGLRQLPAKMSELMQIARQRGYQRDASWLAIEVLRKDEDQHPDVPRQKSGRGFFSWLAGRPGTRVEEPDHESSSESMSGEEEPEEKGGQTLGRLWSDRVWRLRLILLGIAVVILAAAAIFWAASRPEAELPDESTAPSETQPVITATTTPAPTPIPTATPVPTEPPVLLVVTANRLNMREQPGRTANLLMTLSKGDVLEQLEEAEEDWIKVKTADGVIGYVFAPYTSPQE